MNQPHGMRPVFQDEGATSVIRFRQIRVRWTSTTGRPIVRRSRSVAELAARLVPLEVRNLLSNVPLMIGPTISVASISSNAGPLGATPHDLDLHRFAPLPGPSGQPFDPRLLLMAPRISGPVGYLHAPPLPFSAANPPGDRTGGGPDLSGGGPGAPTGPPGKPRSMISEANVLKEGKIVPEVAVADDQHGTVTVYLDSTVVYQLGGLNDPEGVKLADMNNDGRPDLIVAASGDNKILMYTGLAGGGFGPELNQGKGIAVGTDPVALTVDDLNHDGRADLIVVNKGSNNLSILLGAGTGSAWTLKPSQTVAAGVAPVRAQVAPADDDPSATNLLICNSGSSDVDWYNVAATGRVDPQPKRIFQVGTTPMDMLLGRFSHRPDLDLVTVNPGSASMTYIAGVFTPDAGRQDFAPPGFQPVAAVPVPIDGSGVNDLLVASHDGQVALFDADDSSLRMTGLVASIGLTDVTSIVAGQWTPNGLSLFETSSDTSSVALLRFSIDDGGIESSSTGTSLTSVATSTYVTTTADRSLDVEIVSIGGGVSNLVGVLWSRSNRSLSSDDLTAADGSARSSRPPTQGAGSGSADLDHDAVIASGQLTEADEVGSDGTSPQWTRFVLGLDAALDAFGGEMAAVAANEQRNLDEWPEDLQDQPRLVEPRIGTGRSIAWLDGDSNWLDSPQFQALPIATDRDQAATLRAIDRFNPDAVTSGTSELTTAAVGSAVAVRLLIKTTPPRPTRFRPDRQTRSAQIVAGVNAWPEVTPPGISIG